MPTERRTGVHPPRLLSVANVVSIVANIAIVAGVGFAFVQITQANQFERRRIAIEATAPTRSPEFLTAYSKLRDAYRDDPAMPSSASLWADLTYVVNVYDNIAILRLAGLADKDLVDQRVRRGVKTLVPILDAMKWPREYRANFDALLSDLERSS